jgi:hypothetical protein
MKPSRLALIALVFAVSAASSQTPVSVHTFVCTVRRTKVFAPTEATLLR